MSFVGQYVLAEPYMSFEASSTADSVCVAPTRPHSKYLIMLCGGILLHQRDPRNVNMSIAFLPQAIKFHINNSWKRHMQFLIAVSVTHLPPTLRFTKTPISGLLLYAEMKDEHARLARVLITLVLNPTVLAVAYARCLTSRTFRSSYFSLGNHTLL